MRRKCLHLFPLISILLLFSAFSYGQAWSGILASSRATDWTYAGIPGGIPSRTTICANVLTSDTTAQIQTKITNCPVNQVVNFPAGTWTVTGLHSNKPIVLRGAGPTQTLINLSGGDIFFSVNGTGGLGSYPPNLGSTNWTSGLTKGSTVLTLASTAALAAGQRIVLDQHNASYVFPDGVEGTCISGNSCGRNDSPLQFYGAETRAQPEMVEIQSVDSSTQITIKAPGVAYDHSSSLAPQAFYWNTSGGGNIQYAGVEDMKINANSNDFAISMPFCDYCWVKNVEVDNTARAAVFFWWAMHDEVRDSYFSSTETGAPTQYGIEFIATSFAKIENNIFFGITAGVLPETSYGTVLGYNYINNTVSGNMFASIEPHLSHNYLQLYEGNVVNGITYDNSWGSSSQNTTFRNRSWGNGTNKTNYRIPWKAGAHNRYENVVGNVLGDASVHHEYQCDNINQAGTDDYIYDLGYWNGCGAGLASYDTVVGSSLMRWGNWDVVTYAANGNTNGVRWCTGSGTGNPACTASETASTDPTFPGLSSPSQTLPNSFYLPAQPSWFTTPWGTPSWPPIGPDVTCTTNCIAGVASHAAKTPAQLCYENTAKNGSGFLTAFDANVCYAAAPGGGPPPPSGLSATAQ